MKRYGKSDNLIEEIVDYSNLYASAKQVIRGKKRKRSRMGRYILRNIDKVIGRLQKEISDGSFKISGYRSFDIREGGKVRHIQSICLYERIGCNAIISVMEKYVKRRLIRNTAASVKGRGMHYLKSILQEDIRNDPNGTKYFYKFDIKKYYESIDQEVMMDCLRHMFKDKTLLTILERFVRMMGGTKGISIGLRSSQLYGNMLISMALDHLLFDQFHIKYFYRYCDDGVILSGDKKTLWIIRDYIMDCIEKVDLKIKKNERVAPTANGIDFLGYVIYSGDYARLRKRNKLNAARKLHKIKSKRRRKEIVNSLYAQSKHASCHNLFRKLTGITMEEFVKLKSTGIQAKYSDGKKRFEGNEVNLSDLVDNEFLVLDFETDVITRPQRRDYEREVEEQRKLLDSYITKGVTPPSDFLYPDKIKLPQGKYVVSIRRNYQNETSKIEKFFTGDSENKSLLDQMKSNGYLGKVVCSVKQIRCKGYSRYVLS